MDSANNSDSDRTITCSDLTIGFTTDYTTDESDNSLGTDESDTSLGVRSHDLAQEKISGVTTTVDVTQNNHSHNAVQNGDSHNAVQNGDANLLSTSDEELDLSNGIDNMSYSNNVITDSTSSTGSVSDTISDTISDSVSDTELARQHQHGEGQGIDAFTHFSSEWSSLLDKIEDSVEKVSKNYEGWRPETVRQQYGNSYWQYPANIYCKPGTSKSCVSQMTEEQADKWASAPEFHPAFTSRTGRVKTYAEAVDPYAPRTRTKLATGVQFCPYYHLSRAELYLCPYLHGELCQICLNAILDFEDTEEKQEHIKECLREQEKRMKMSLAIQKSKGITCNICLEPVKEKNAGEARFGLLPNCNHCFCITCIRKWRQESRFTSQITRSCPICRVESPFVCPSSFWVETPEEKAAVITNYKKALRVKPCRLYNFGNGRCPFGEKCFYLHALPDGTKPEQPDIRRPKRLNAEGLAHFQEYVLWDFIAMRDDPENYSPSLPPQYPQSLDSSSTESDVSY